MCVYVCVSVCLVTSLSTHSRRSSRKLEIIRFGNGFSFSRKHLQTKLLYNWDVTIKSCAADGWRRQQRRNDSCASCSLLVQEAQFCTNTALIFVRNVLMTVDKKLLKSMDSGGELANIFVRQSVVCTEEGFFASG